MTQQNTMPDKRKPYECQECGEIFEKYLKPSNLKRGEGKYCSISCACRARSRGNKFAVKDR